MSSDQTTATSGTIDIKGRTFERSQVLNAEVKPAESAARNGVFLLTALCFPIAAMVIFSILDGPLMWALGLIAAAGPFLAIAISFVWAKPWGVIVETPERYRCVYQTSDKSEADAIANQVRSAIAH